MKLYTVLALFALLCWHMTLASGEPSAFNPLWPPMNDFNGFTKVASTGYFIAATILLWGGLWQMFIYSRRAAAWSLVFAVAAIIIGVWLPNYGFDFGFNMGMGNLVSVRNQ